MFTSKPLGSLTAFMTIPRTANPNPNASELAESPVTAVSTTEITIPLLEGGLLYRGVLTIDQDSRDVTIRVSRSVLDATRVAWDDKSPNRYVVTIDTQALNDLSRSFDLTIAVSPTDQQQFSGELRPQHSPSSVSTFIYKDINEPITIGVTTIVVVGAGALMCICNQLIGKAANKDCKHLDVVYGFNFNFKNPLDTQIGCRVRCLDK
jgi:hypothetical protein